MQVRRFLAALTTALLVGVLAPVVLAAPAAAAPNCDLGGFEIDGNTPQNCAPVRDDWANQPGTALGAGGLYDSATSKDTLTTSTWTTAVGSPPNNLTINNATSFQRTGADGHVYLYVRWDRTATNGTGKYAVEVTNAGGVVVAGAPRPDRSLGGVVAYLQFQGGGAPTLGQFCTYTSQANYPTSVNPTAAGCTTTPPNTSFANAASGAFIEVGFDLTALGISTPGCTATADTSALYVRSIFGNEATGNLSGFRPPVAVTAPSTCGTLEISKESLNDLVLDDPTEFDYEVGVDGSDPVVEDSITIGGSDSFQVAPGTEYEITEFIPDGAPWSLWSVVCTLGDESVTLVDDGEVTGETLEVATGETTSCVITNATSLLTVVKGTTPAGADAVFNFDVDETVDAFALGDGESFTIQFAPGSVVSVTEQQIEGWDLDTVDCGQATSTPITGGVDVTTSAGNTVTCTFGNEQRGTVNITKASLNDLATDDPTDFEWAFGDGGTEPLAEGDLEVGDSDQVVNVLPGDGYTLEETIPDGAPWVLWSIVCQIGTQPEVTIVDDGEYTGDTIPVQPGQTTNCVITNATSIVSVEKQTNPDGSEATFDFDASGQDPFTLADGDTETFQYLPGSDVTITEDAKLGWDLDSVDCEPNGDPVPGGITVTTSEGSTTACVFTNEQRGSISITKGSLNDLALSDTSTFGWVVGDGSQTPVADGDLTIGATDTVVNVLPGSGYTLSEDEILPVDAPWILWDIVCSVDGDDYTLVDDGDIVAEATFPVLPGVTTDCVITNATSYVAVEKQTTPDGSAQSFEFLIDNAGFSLSDGQSTSFQQKPGDQVTVVETVPAGWDLMSVVCDGEESEAENGVLATTAAGAINTCVFTNQQHGTIIIEKIVVGLEDSTFDYTGDLGPFSIETSGGLGDESFTVSAGSYSVTETAEPGYDTTNLVCDTEDGVEIDTVTWTVTVELDPAEVVTCAFTNTERGLIVVQKATVPANYDQDFNFTFNGNQDFTLNDFDDPEWQSDLLEPGTYTVTENTLPDGWTLGGISCGDVDGSTATIELEPGQTVTCVVTNNAVPGTATLTKSVTGVTDDYQWSFDVILTQEPDGAPVVQQVTNGDLPDSAVATWSNLVVGATYTLEEGTLPFGWTSQGIECGEIDDESDAAGFQFTVTPGFVLDCTLTNAADPAEVELTKTVSNINPDAEWSFDFTLDADEQALTDADPVGDWADLLPGTEYTIFEDDVPGWTEGAITCVPNVGEVALDADAEEPGFQFTATPGLVLTCTADNAADPADLTVTKTTVGGNGEFEFTVTQLVEEGEEFVDTVTTAGGTGELVFADLVPGYEYSVAETHLPAGWTAGVLECVITDVQGDEFEVDPAGFDVQPGDLIECAITNTKQAMAVTGSTMPLVAVWAALLLLLAGGGALVLVSRQRRRNA